MKIAIQGIGAVSPAGWGVRPMLDVLTGDAPVPETTVEKRADSPHCEVRVRRVPKPEEKLPFLRNPRLRRSSPVGRQMAAAALEALGPERAEAVKAGNLRLGVISTMLCGCVNYSRRFFSEALADPATASPIVFPETVFNAPSSHLSAVLGSPEINYTLVGDSAEFIVGIDLAAQWLEDGVVDGVLVVAGEEFDWLSAEALQLFAGKNSVVGEGGAAVYLEKADDCEVELAQVTNAVSFSKGISRAAALRKVKDELTACSDAAYLFDGRSGCAVFDRDEARVWKDWKGGTLYLAKVLGIGLGVSAAWQFVTACGFIQSGKCAEAVVSAAGMNEQCVAAKVKSGKGSL